MILAICVGLATVWVCYYRSNGSSGLDCQRDECICDIHSPAESVVATIKRKGKLLIPHGSTELKSGNILTIVGDRHAESEIRQLSGT
ncbi:MAG TPA: TrkA C-terminal domain-containing protein [Phototrophicaceae bacterium]|jgi:uncharacterized transporter YbjL|nr:TrkA C-terminal domain-containing protein [Phototrophicaceae bacterium]